MSDLLIRRAEEKDIADVARLLCQVLEVHADGRPDLLRHGTRKYNDGELAEIFRDDTRPVFVAVREGRVLGYAFCVLEEAQKSHALIPVRTLYIDDLCVDETCRNAHVGTALYDHVVAFAKESGCYHVTLNVWCFNSPAMEFYKRKGMTPLKITMEQLL